MSRRSSQVLGLLVAALILLVAGCSQREGSQGPQSKQGGADQDKAVSRVIVPDSVRKSWKAVKIAVLDKETDQKETYTVDIGYEFALAGSKVSLRVKNFLPAFVMDGATMTSASDEPNNPAVQVLIREDGVEVFEGWLFSLYPGNQTFRHPRFVFSLVDFIPAAKKG